MISVAVSGLAGQTVCCESVYPPDLRAFIMCSMEKCHSTQLRQRLENCPTIPDHALLLDHAMAPINVFNIL